MQRSENHEADSYGEDATNSSFIAEFYDGYSFKNLVDFLRRINTTAVFEFRPHLIECYHHDQELKNILAHVVIKGKDLYKYHLETEGDSLSVGVNLRDLQKLIKSIGKKDSLTIYKKKKEQFIYIQVSNSNNKSSQNNFSILRPCKVEQVIIDIPRYNTPEDYPNLILASNSISNTANSMNVLKSSLVRIRVQGNDLTIDNLSDDRSSGRVDSFAMRKYDGEKIEYESLVKVQTLKALSKLQNLNPSGLLKLYLEEGKPIKIVSRLASFGKLRAYLSSVDE